ncbi:hypothetical protein SAMN02745751_02166 [Dethiosulfatibacter aminovorans DSM 17477]|uniref:Uncharacterized protein n=1 Tax=Dethiosulfatibacter aminovorans DSM 17477 TaxID=1121476 RepID=A0A1M6I0R5_9FIRM|nr:hypothetical protein [Dethiosulfatibacter aminovorans]SHJ28053.1 hypothetical protein SAMN02745751_02166 [Dethiosulfatibacter aminovorans DSM 17477]
MHCSNLRIFENRTGKKNFEIRTYLESEGIRHSFEELKNIENGYAYYTVYFKGFMDCTKLRKSKYKFESYEIIGNAVRFKVCDNKRSRRCFMKFLVNFENGIRRFEFI